MTLLITFIHRNTFTDESDMNHVQQNGVWLGFELNHCLQSFGHLIS